MEFVDLPFICCGFPLEPVDNVLAFSLAARNLMIAKKENLDIVVLCSACRGTLDTAASVLNKDTDLLKKVNARLNRLGLKYEAGVRVKHFGRVLVDYYGTERLRRLIRKPLDRLRIAVHYGCHYVRPSETQYAFDDPEAPESIDEIVKTTGAKSIEYVGKMDCCGGAVVGIDEEVAVKMAKMKLDHIAEAEADALVLCCPFCAVMYDKFQGTVAENLRGGVQYNIPVLYLPQLLGLALGLKPDELGLGMNAVSAEQLLGKLG